MNLITVPSKKMHGIRVSNGKNNSHTKCDVALVLMDSLVHYEADFLNPDIINDH